MLHLTNGDAAADRIRAAGVSGEVVAWRDVLHEGPVPAALDLVSLAGVRAEFIAGRGWADAARARAGYRAQIASLHAASGEDEVRALVRARPLRPVAAHPAAGLVPGAPGARLSLIAPEAYLGRADPAWLRARFDERKAVAGEQLEEGRLARAAFRAPHPGAMETLDATSLPFVGPAFTRLLEQLPGAEDGLSRSERCVLAALGDGPRSAGELFRLHNEAEDPLWLGDSVFAGYLEELARGPHPLLSLSGGGPWHSRMAAQTSAGAAVLAGCADAVALRGIDRWLGGIHLQGRGPLWRWDRVSRRVVER